MLPQTIQELNFDDGIPIGFIAIEQHDSSFKDQRSLDAVVNAISKSLNFTLTAKELMRIDMEMIAEAGYYAAGAVRSQVPDEAIFSCSVVFASSNFNALKRILGTEEKRKEVERIIDLYGFEHLITVRFISNEGWYDVHV